MDNIQIILENLSLKNECEMLRQENERLHREKLQGAAVTIPALQVRNNQDRQWIWHYESGTNIKK